jgi:RNA polymerase sigma factor (sigma-70 family)
MAVDDRRPATVRTGRADQPDRGERIASLVGEARQGSEEALGQIVTELTPMLWQVARAAGLSAGDAEDVVQTVWMRLIAHLDDIHTSAALTGWLVITARREAWRVCAAGRKQLPADTESFDALPTRGPGAEEQVIIDDQRRTLWRAISQLPGRCQELLRIIAFVPRPDYAAVAAELGMPIGSVGPTRGRCLAKLRTLLASTLEGDDVVG